MEHQSSIQYRMRSVEGGDIIDKDDIDTTIRDRFNVTEITNMSYTGKGSSVIGTGGIIMRSRLIAIALIGRNELVYVEAMFTYIPSIWRSDTFQINLNTQRAPRRLIEDDFPSNVEVLPVS